MLLQKRYAYSCQTTRKTVTGTAITAFRRTDSLSRMKKYTPREPRLEFWRNPRLHPAELYPSYRYLVLYYESRSNQRRWHGDGRLGSNDWKEVKRHIKHKCCRIDDQQQVMKPQLKGECLIFYKLVITMFWNWNLGSVRYHPRHQQRHLLALRPLFNQDISWTQIWRSFLFFGGLTVYTNKNQFKSTKTRIRITQSIKPARGQPIEFPYTMLAMT